MPPEQAARVCAGVVHEVERFVFGNADLVRLTIACLLARGHVLIEGQPGVGKTALARSLAHVLGLGWKRAQFTSDLLPHDLIGSLLPYGVNGALVFTEGPLFTNLLIADEVNRASPKTQAALLQAMEERQVSIETESRPRQLQEPFFVVATENPVEMVGTFPLPEAQLDRFLMKVTMQFAEPEAELAMLAADGAHEALDHAPPSSPVEVGDLVDAAAAVRVSREADEYLVRLAWGVRTHPSVAFGVSPRGVLALRRASRAWALMRGSGAVLPDDVKYLAVPVWAHRIGLKARDVAKEDAAAQVVADVVDSTPVRRADP